MAPFKVHPSLFERLQVRFQSYPVSGDVIRYYPYRNNLAFFYTGVMSINGQIYDMDTVDTTRSKVYKNFEMWMCSLPNHPTVNDVTVNYRLGPHPFYDQPPLSSRENLNELPPVDMSRFMPGDIIRYYPFAGDDTVCYEGIITKMMQVYEVSHPCRARSRYEMYQSIFEYVDMINDDDNGITADDLLVNQALHDESYLRMSFEIQEVIAQAEREYRSVNVDM